MHLDLNREADMSKKEQGLGNPWLEWWSGATQSYGPVYEYWLDACQRGILTLDVLRERGNAYEQQRVRLSPCVLGFDAEIVLDGRTFERPVNYTLMRIKPPTGMKIDVGKRPFIIFDPRAGQGPGIGGMKHDSEIGEVLQAGHPCYFVGFLEDPMPGQTVEDVCQAEARFVARVAELHPEAVAAEGRPCLIGNCQAGWQIMIMSAIHPDVIGPVMLAGSPLSYWQGVHGKAPMRYSGGLLGGTWLTALAGDLGNGRFDGAHLVANFESMHPSNTYWKKLYRLYSKVDTEAPRFLEFEKWWGNPVLLNAGEMQWITDELFVGNKLAVGDVHTSDGLRVDLRNIKSPIIIFCSFGDDITPPQQALDWVLDLYEDVDELIANGQTVVYTLNQSIGHLGIFVSGQVATKEDEELIDCMDMIDLLPPGLYEAVITEPGPEVDNPQLIHGRYLLSVQARTLDDIRALGGNGVDDDQCFASVDAVSKINEGLYQTFISPMLRGMVNEQSAALLRELHPNRLPFSLFSDKNPLMPAVAEWTEAVRVNRRPVAADNPLLTLEKWTSDGIVKTLDAFTDARDAMVEAMFFSIYGAPLLQALVGLRAEGAETHRHAVRNLVREAAVHRMETTLEQRFESGSLLEAALRALIYIRDPDWQVDERNFSVLRELAAEQPASMHIGHTRFKELMKEQFLIMRLDEERALAAIPQLLPNDDEQRAAMLRAIHRLITASGALPEEKKPRLARIEALFGKPAEERSSHGQPRKPAIAVVK